MINKIKYLAEKYFDEIVEIRRHLHKYPELSFNEFQTSKYIKSILKKWQIKYIDNVAGNGIVVLLERGKKNDRTVALRADFDALPIHEQNNVSYCSKNKGVMHACGHDAHTASLLGVIKILNSNEIKWTGKIKCIFQPAEEMLPGGAKQMIKEGVLKNPNVNYILAHHVYPDLVTGKIGFCEGKYMASTDELYIKVNGIGGHAALPDKYNNPILAASDLITKLSNHFSKSEHPKSVFAIGYISADGSTNVIPNCVNIKGTFRAIDEKWRIEAHNIMLKISEKISKKHNVKIQFDIVKGYPHLINNINLTRNSRKYAEEFLGKQNVIDLDIRMTAEDFAYFSHEVPGCFYRVGTRNELLGITNGLHTSKFDIDEKSLKTSMGVMTYLAIKNLS